MTPLHEALRNYVTKSTAAFLEGKQNLKWICGVLLHSGLNREDTVQIIAPTIIPFDTPRRWALCSWLDLATW